MTSDEQKIFDKFISWLEECSSRDEEDIHYTDFSTYEAKCLYEALKEEKR